MAQHRSGVRVLIIDDDADIRDLYATYLEEEGFRVELAADGREGLKQAHVLRPDIIVLDLSMPQIDGWTLCQTLKRTPLTRGIPVIAVTGFVDDKSRERAQAAGVDVFLSKPCLPEELAHEIQRSLAACHPSPAPGPKCARCGGVFDEREHVAFEGGDLFHTACIIKDSRELIDASRMKIAESHERMERAPQCPAPPVNEEPKQ
jgi:CheY-like chemotaxis protein